MHDHELSPTAAARALSHYCRGARTGVTSGHFFCRRRRPPLHAGIISRLEKEREKGGGRKEEKEHTILSITLLYLVFGRLLNVESGAPVSSRGKLPACSVTVSTY